MFSKDRKPFEMIVLFKLVIQGENEPVTHFLARLEEVAAEEGVKFHSIENAFMMPSRNIFQKDQTEMVLQRIKEFKG